MLDPINGGATRCVASPPLVPDEPVDLFKHADVIGAVIGLVERLAHAKREGDLDSAEYAEAVFNRIPGLRDLVHLVANGLTYRETQRANQARKSGPIRKRNIAMAEEFADRELRYALRNETISFSALAEQVGRLPQFNLGRSAAIEAIKTGKRCLNVRSPRHAGHEA